MNATETEEENYDTEERKKKHQSQVQAKDMCNGL